jgi:hypothetical protein
MEAKAQETPASKAPDGGLSAWLVILGCWCILFCSFGWINSELENSKKIFVDAACTHCLQALAHFRIIIRGIYCINIPPAPLHGYHHCKYSLFMLW